MPFHRVKLHQQQLNTVASTKLFEIKVNASGKQCGLQCVVSKRWTTGLIGRVFVVKVQ